MKKITIVFYEYPKAMHEINMWEKSKRLLIQSKEFKSGNEYIFNLDDEIVYCTPSLSIDEIILNKLKIGNYNKTLLFGKFDSHKLLKITELVKTFEKYTPKPEIIHLDGVDKTGKDTLRKQLLKISNGNYLIYVRSFVSQIAYSRIYGRNINEEYFFKKIKEESERGVNFFITVCDEDDFKKRYVEHDEKDLKISDYIEHSEVFYQVCDDIFKKTGVCVKPINTSKSVEESANDLIKEL